eukprot:1362574-Rhodomonas_salina.1
MTKIALDSIGAFRWCYPSQACSSVFQVSQLFVPLLVVMPAYRDSNAGTAAILSSERHSGTDQSESTIFPASPENLE